MGVVMLNLNPLLGIRLPLLVRFAVFSQKKCVVPDVELGDGVMVGLDEFV